MLYFEKSQPAPECLDIEKRKGSKNYRCGNVLPLLRSDFKNKCYLCEQANPTTINVEHFRPHKGDRELMFNWNNLFWACGHCNTMKGSAFTDLLDCTDAAQQVESKLRLSIKPYPGEKSSIEAIDQSEQTLTTRKLLLMIFNGEIRENGRIIKHTTMQKRMEADNLRQKLLDEMFEFQLDLREYARAVFPDDKVLYERRIKRHLSPFSSFTSFKRWVIRDNDRLLAEFGRFLT